MKVLIGFLLLSLFSYASAITSNGFIYTFDESGTPKYRITSNTGIVETFSKYGWVDMRFKEHIKDLKIFNDNEFINQSYDTKKKVLTNYFNKEIKSILKDLDKENIDKLLHIFIIHATK